LQKPERGCPDAGNKPVPNQPGIDGESFLSGQSYAPALTDTDGLRVPDFVENRDKQAVKGVFKCLNGEQPKAVKSISMDFRQAFVSTAEELLPNAGIVHVPNSYAEWMNSVIQEIKLWRDVIARVLYKACRLLC